LCWLVRRSHGEDRLGALLEGYLAQSPFAVLSDPMPAGYVGRPAVTLERLGLSASDPKRRKEIKARRWLPEHALDRPLSEWGACLASDHQVIEALGLKGRLSESATRQHNSLNRMTGSTGAGEAGFAPFSRDITWFHPEVPLSLFAAFDEAKLSADELQDLLQQLGMEGYGKEASSGCGKFDVVEFTPYHQLAPPAPNAWLTLAPVAPQGLAWVASDCFYEVFTRFGRHGDVAVHTGKPFKNPVLMAQSFAILTPSAPEPGRTFTGQGLTGLSKAIESTVQQGYSPVLAVQMEAA
jgi:CRISPR-associated protein Csm4